MADPLLLDLITFLKTEGVVAGDGIDAFRDFTPETPDNLVVLYEYSGSPTTQFDPAVHRSVQVTCRNISADLARQKALDIFKALRNKIELDNRLQIVPSRWGQVYLRQTPFKLKTDENDRAYYVFNIGITTSIE